MIKTVRFHGQTKHVEIDKEDSAKMLANSIKENIVVAKQVLAQAADLPAAIQTVLVQAAVTHVAYRTESIIVKRLLREQEEKEVDVGE